MCWLLSSGQGSVLEQPWPSWSEELILEDTTGVVLQVGCHCHCLPLSVTLETHGPTNEGREGLGAVVMHVIVGGVNFMRQQRQLTCSHVIDYSSQDLKGMAVLPKTFFFSEATAVVNNHHSFNLGRLSAQYYGSIVVMNL